MGDICVELRSYTLKQKKQKLLLNPNVLSFYMTVTLRQSFSS